MLKRFRDKKKNNKGFTLVELVVVVAILAILVGLLAPQYTKYVERSRKAADVANLDSLVKAVEVAVADNVYSDLVPATGSKNVVIVINKNETTITYDGGANPTLTKALREYAGNNWNETTLKSKSWKTKADSKAIKATLTIDSKGSVTVVYDPEDLKNKEADA